MSNTQGMMTADHRLRKQNGQKRALQANGGQICSMSTPTLCMKLPVSGSALLVQGVRLLLGKQRLLHEQIELTHFGFLNMVKASLPGPKLPQTDNAMTDRNISAKFAFYAMTFKHVQCMSLA